MHCKIYKKSKERVIITAYKKAGKIFKFSGFCYRKITYFKILKMTNNLFFA